MDHRDDIDEYLEQVAQEKQLPIRFVRPPVAETLEEKRDLQRYYEGICELTRNS